MGKHADATGWSLFWRADKRRWVFSTAPDWKQKLVPDTFGKSQRKDAEVWALAWRTEQQKLGAIPTRAERIDGPTIRTLHEKWLKHRETTLERGRRKFSTATIDDNRSHVENLMLRPLAGSTEDERAEPEAIADIPIARLTPVRIREWVRRLAAKFSSYYVSNVVSTARVLVGDAVDEGWVLVVENPFAADAVRRAIPKRQRSKGTGTPWIPADDVQAVVDRLDIPLQRRVRYVVGATSGLRDSEIAGLTWADVDLDAAIPILDVNKGLATRGPEGWASMADTKTEDSVRKVPIHRAAIAALKEWRDLGWKVYVGTKPKPETPVFPNPDGDFFRPKSAEHLRRDLKSAGRSTKCDGQDVVFHSLRATFSTCLDDAGVEGKTVDRLMGHAGKTTALRHYTAANLALLQRAVELIPIEWPSGATGTPSTPKGPMPTTPSSGSTEGGAVGNNPKVDPSRGRAASLTAGPPTDESANPSTVPSSVPGSVPESQKNELTAEPPSRFELETYGLRKPRRTVPASGPATETPAVTESERRSANGKSSAYGCPLGRSDSPGEPGTVKPRGPGTELRDASELGELASLRGYLELAASGPWSFLEAAEAADGAWS